MHLFLNVYDFAFNPPEVTFFSLWENLSCKLLDVHNPPQSHFLWKKSVVVNTTPELNSGSTTSDRVDTGTCHSVTKTVSASLNLRAF